LDDLPAEGRNADSPGGKNGFHNCCPTFLD